MTKQIANVICENNELQPLFEDIFLLKRMSNCMTERSDKTK